MPFYYHMQVLKESSVGKLGNNCEDEVTAAGGEVVEAHLKMANPFRIYQMMMSKHSWKVQILTAGTLVGCSDVVSQQLVERRGFAKHDTKRTIRMTAVGLIYVGPVLGVWYKVLDKIIVGHSKTVAFKKMLLDQFALAPCFLACFLAIASFLGGHSPEEVWLKLKKVAPYSDCCTDVEYLPLVDGKQMRFI
ncbi:mitochondrial inner membrane protein Mpv17 isoform X3 [Scyliorhinus torazame]|uniref:mitochondrial inner membrane protein Mpv17 isoform X3 n=1 Tax=Scyliorhinus torazame TaxID=75743 RepID=UPI003B5AA16C